MGNTLQLQGLFAIKFGDSHFHPAHSLSVEPIPLAFHHPASAFFYLDKILHILDVVVAT